MPLFRKFLTLELKEFIEFYFHDHNLFNIKIQYYLRLTFSKTTKALFIRF